MNLNKIKQAFKADSVERTGEIDGVAQYTVMKGIREIATGSLIKLQNQAEQIFKDRRKSRAQDDGVDYGDGR